MGVTPIPTPSGAGALYLQDDQSKEAIRHPSAPWVPMSSKPTKATKSGSRAAKRNSAVNTSLTDEIDRLKADKDRLLDRIKGMESEVGQMKADLDKLDLEIKIREKEEEVRQLNLREAGSLDAFTPNGGGPPGIKADVPLSDVDNRVVCATRHEKDIFVAPITGAVPFVPTPHIDLRPRRVMIAGCLLIWLLRLLYIWVQLDFEISSYLFVPPQYFSLLSLLRLSAGMPLVKAELLFLCLECSLYYVVFILWIMMTCERWALMEEYGTVVDSFISAHLIYKYVTEYEFQPSVSPDFCEMELTSKKSRVVIYKPLVVIKSTFGLRYFEKLTKFGVGHDICDSVGISQLQHVSTQMVPALVHQKTIVRGSSSQALMAERVVRLAESSLRYREDYKTYLNTGRSTLRATTQLAVYLATLQPRAVIQDF